MQAIIHYITLYVLDCMPIIHFGLNARFAQEADFRLLGSASCFTELMDHTTKQPSDVIVVDYSLTRDEFDGVGLLKRLNRATPSSRVLVWASDASPAFAALAMRAGAAGFLAKTHGDLQQLVDAIRLVASGRNYVAPEFRNSEIRDLSTYDDHNRDQDDDQDDRPSNFDTLIGDLLSQKELEVVRCCLECMSMTEIAGKFNRSVKTVSTQKNSAYRKLGIRNDLELFKVCGNLLKSESM